MDKSSVLQILALLENARIAEEYQPASNPHSAEFALRLASAHVAAFFGYDTRIAWTEEISKAGLINYSPESHTDHQTALYNIESIINGSPVAAGINRH